MGFSFKIKVSIESAALDRIADALEKIAENTRPHIKRPGKPNIFIFEQATQGGISMLKFKVLLPAFDPANPNDDDVTTRKLSVTIGAGTAIEVTAAAADTEVNDDRFVGNAGDAVTVSLVDSDAAGNASPPSELLATTLIDNIAPPAPGMAGLAVTGQV